MGRIKQRDIQDILKLFENELNMISRMSKIEKMKARKRILNALSSSVAMNIKKPELFLATLEGKLYDVFDLFNDSWGFREKLARKIREKLQKKPDPQTEEQ